MYLDFPLPGKYNRTDDIHKSTHHVRDVLFSDCEQRNQLNSYLCYHLLSLSFFLKPTCSLHLYPILIWKEILIDELTVQTTLKQSLWCCSCYNINTQ